MNIINEKNNCRILKQSKFFKLACSIKGEKIEYLLMLSLIEKIKKKKKIIFIKVNAIPNYDGNYSDSESDANTINILGDNNVMKNIYKFEGKFYLSDFMDSIGNSEWNMNKIYDYIIIKLKKSETDIKLIYNNKHLIFMFMVESKFSQSTCLVLENIKIYKLIEEYLKDKKLKNKNNNNFYEFENENKNNLNKIINNNNKIKKEEENNHKHRKKAIHNNIQRNSIHKNNNNKKIKYNSEEKFTKFNHKLIKRKQKSELKEMVLNNNEEGKKINDNKNKEENRNDENKVNIINNKRIRAKSNFNSNNNIYLNSIKRKNVIEKYINNNKIEDIYYPFYPNFEDKNLNEKMKIEGNKNNNKLSLNKSINNKIEDNVIHFLNDSSSRDYYILEKKRNRTKEKKNSVKKIKYIIKENCSIKKEIYN